MLKFEGVGTENLVRAVRGPELLAPRKRHQEDGTPRPTIGPVRRREGIDSLFEQIDILVGNKHDVATSVEGQKGGGNVDGIMEAYRAKTAEISRNLAKEMDKLRRDRK